MLGKIIKRVWRIAIYVRLSKEDEKRFKDKKDSESVQNQIAFLKAWVKDFAIACGVQTIIFNIYIDDGYTGCNFDRPDFIRLINDIELKNVNLVVTKDLSRLGRDYIDTGYYVEKYFPVQNVRYIAVNDNIDTFDESNSNNDMTPFKSVINDMYSKDLSKKIRASLTTMQKEGKWVGGATPLGYMQDPKDKNKLIINEEEGKIVKKIFELALVGRTTTYIKNYLNDNNIPTASKIRKNCITEWTPRTIKNIVKNPLYVGDLVQNRRSRISYKNRKIRENPEENWIIVKDTHAPLVDRKDFNTLQKMAITGKYTRNEKTRTSLLDGLLFCYECKFKIGLKYAKARDTLYITCNNYRKNSKLRICTPHQFRYDDLEKKVLETIRSLFKHIDSKKVELNAVNNKTTINHSKQIATLKKEISLIRDGIDKIYMDKVTNKISEEMYERVYKKFKKDFEYKEQQCKELEEDSKQDNNQDLEKIVKEFLKLKKLTPEFMRVIINRIEVHQDKQVDIIFNLNCTHL